MTKERENPAEITTCDRCGVGRRLPAPCGCPHDEGGFRVDER